VANEKKGRGADGHAFFAPSKSGTWWLGGCSASTVVDVSSLRERAKPAADHGTMLHGVAEKMLRSGSPAAPDSLTPPDRRSVEAYVEYVRGRKGKKLFEFVSELVPGLCGGTADSVILDFEEDLLEVVDYKSGSGFVEVRENPQEIIYAAGVLKKLRRLLGHEFKRVRLTIVQPAMGDATPTRWETTVANLLERADEAIAAVGAVVDGRVEFNATEENCRWCPAVAICPEYERFRQAAARDAFSEFIGPAPVVSDEPTWGDRLRLVPFLKKWIKAVEDHTRNMGIAGEPPDGFKVVEGRKGNRDWTAEGKRRALDFLAKLGFEETDLYGEAPVVSPAKADELLKMKFKKEELAEHKKTLEQHWEHGKPGSPTVVPEDDSRPAIDKGDLARRDFAEFITREETPE